MMNGYITTTRKKHYVLLTDKKKVTIYMLAAFLRKIVESEGIDSEKLRGALSERQAIAALRKRIEPCRVEKRGDKLNRYWHIEVGKSENPHAFLNCPEADDAVVEVFDTKDNALITEIFGN